MLFKKTIVLSLLIIFIALMSITINKQIKNLHKNKITLDVYGTKDLSTRILKEKFAPQFNKLADILQSPVGLNSSNNQTEMCNTLLYLISEIKKLGNFNFVNISPIMYPGDKVTHITIDIVDAKQKARLLYFNSTPTKTIDDPAHLVSSWLAYEHEGFEFIFKEKRQPHFDSCPAHHCLFGFEEANFRKYAIQFKAVEQNKAALINVLRNDKDPNKRAAAAFLLAHIRSARELVNVLLPSIYDVNEKVRNNAMRVIGLTLLKEPIDNFPIEKVMRALDFPVTSDRNKAMVILSSLADKPKYAEYISKNAGKELLEELKLEQPNNHGLSYQILKKITRQNYAERDYQSWEKYLNQQMFS